MARLAHFLKSVLYLLRPGAAGRLGLLATYVLISVADARRARLRSVRLLKTSFSFPSVFEMRFLVEEVVVFRHYAVWPPAREHPLIIDGGANVGLVTLYYKRLFPGARILSIEPHPVTARYLRRNVEAGGLQDVEVVERALAGQPGSYALTGTNLTASLSSTPTEDSATVEAVSLSSLVSESETIDILKLDIEGCELGVLRSFAEDLSRIDQIVAEIHISEDRPDPLPEILEMLRTAGHRYELAYWASADDSATCIMRSWRSAVISKTARRMAV